MKRTKIAGFERLKKDLTADQLALNLPFRRVIETMRHINVERDPKKIDGVLRSLNKSLYVLPAFDPVSGPRWELRFSPKKRSWFLATPTVWTCLETVVECANNRELDRFRQCPVCQRWFYAHKSDQQFCGERWSYDGKTVVREKSTCRQKMHARSPKFKARRAEYMRELRARDRQREIEETERFRKSLQSKQPNLKRRAM
jgi:hypothetical protein